MMRLALLLAGLTLGDSEARPPRDEADARLWLQNMVWFHRFSPAEITAATGLDAGAITTTLRASEIEPGNRPPRRNDAPILVLPYPGGRHPRIGFLEGAARPQRETKISVFTPWDEASYVVVDLPEAIFSNLGLTYLAHTHVPTVWTRQGIILERQEWSRREDGTLESERRLPNGITFGAKAVAGGDAVRMELWLSNGTAAELTGLRVQNCVLLKGAKGFEEQTNENKRFQSPFAMCRSSDGRRWIITTWERCQRAWGNPPCPCLHSDPTFPDCPPGQTRRLRGWLSFYEGDDIEAELRRLAPLVLWGQPTGGR
jgi:hypothetical protein